MMNFYTNRELSQKLDVKLAKWKRWSREFLPPDPLGGMQSGYARQYSLEEAFTVYLGGHLVADLKFSIPDAKQILHDLHGWLEGAFFSFNEQRNATSSKGADALIKRYTIFITRETDFQKKNYGFLYTIRGTISDDPAYYDGFQIRQERYIETSIPPQRDRSETIEMNNVKLLTITGLYESFLEKL